MREKGFEKPWQILRSKWKMLKQRYLAERRIQSKSGAGGKITIKFKFFDAMDSILGHRPIVQAMSSVINSMDAEANADTEEPIRETSTDSEASFDVLPMSSDGSEVPDVPEVGESSQAQPPIAPQEAWRRPKKRRASTSSVHMSMIREQAEQDQASLTAITDVLNRVVNCFERATAAAERHARSLEVLAEARLPFPQQPPAVSIPYLQEQQPLVYHHQPTTSYQQQQPPPTSYHHQQQQQPPSPSSPENPCSYNTYHSL
ncbi:uncharacterized protein LOC112141916 [Xyrichtys novacula]|uniref:Uncharacterized protein LOC112141916 n=1 Tax=Xyrichtys novacula TaxID=13765 RepID=A0AAV1H8P4_XYRNO|nr:uncharacterized protein LOC112141916 [Xyrichtys novacula]